MPDPTGGAQNLPARRLSNRDFEMVIRRAAELQARDAEDGAADGIDEGEALRIGRELGLSTRNLHRALVEVTGGAEAEAGLWARLYGPSRVHAGRTVPGDVREIAAKLERYFLEREYLAVLRRLPGRILFTRATGVAAAVGRAASQVVNRSPLLGVSNLEMAVHPLEEGYGYVDLSTSLNSGRTAAAAGSLLGGGSATAMLGGFLGIAVAPPAALLALPVLGVSVWGAGAIYRGHAQKIQIQLEFVLDRLEHGDLVRPPRPTSRFLPRR